MLRVSVLLAAWLTLCATGVSQRGSAPVPKRQSLADVVRSQMEPAGAVAWSSRTLLTWRDFQGHPAGEEDEGAHSAYSLYSAARCVQDSFEFVAVAALLPAQSWVRPSVALDPQFSAATLKHEQTHFDLTETYARRMRKYFEELYDPCSRTEADLDAQAQRYITAEAVMQSRYDEETRNGRVTARQVEWDAEVARQLVSLGRYARDRAPD